LLLTATAAGCTAPPVSSLAVSPAVLRHWYGLDRVDDTGTGQVIGIVVAGRDDHLGADLAQFDTRFHLASMNGLGPGASCDVAAGPHPCLVQQPAAVPPASPPWAVETALDVEWAHAVAPGADIVVSEAHDDSVPALAAAAAGAVTAGATIVDTSWGVPEAPAWRQYAAVFERRGITFVAPAGDSGHGVSFPASVPAVLGVGGTRVDWAPDRSGGRVEAGWARSGGGESSLYTRPPYQGRVALGAGGRLVPDVAYTAQPPGGYPVVVAGRLHRLAATSAAAPQWAGIIALAAQRRGAPIDGGWLHAVMYTETGAAADGPALIDVATGRNGPCGSLCEARTGYDAVTGLGVPNAPALLRLLSRAPTTIPAEEST
jgi:subtilase family serine protease